MQVSLGTMKIEIKFKKSNYSLVKHFFVPNDTCIGKIRSKKFGSGLPSLHY